MNALVLLWFSELDIFQEQNFILLLWGESVYKRCFPLISPGMKTDHWVLWVPQGWQAGPGCAEACFPSLPSRPPRQVGQQGVAAGTGLLPRRVCFLPEALSLSMGHWHGTNFLTVLVTDSSENQINYGYFLQKNVRTLNVLFFFFSCNFRSLGIQVKKEVCKLFFLAQEPSGSLMKLWTFSQNDDVYGAQNKKHWIFKINQLQWNSIKILKLFMIQK